MRNRVQELFDYAVAFSKQPLPSGGDLVIVSNAGGPAIISTDACSKLGIKMANIDDFIKTLPLGLQTKIGAEGNGISQGQKQRLLIARAIYKNPSFLFFDEATNALDANNESRIVENMKAFTKGKTVVIVAHRLSTVRNADKIVVLDQGKIAEEGTHETLTQQRGIYYELVKNQLELGV